MLQASSNTLKHHGKQRIWFFLNSIRVKTSCSIYLLLTFFITILVCNIVRFSTFYHPLSVYDAQSSSLIKKYDNKEVFEMKKIQLIATNNLNGALHLRDNLPLNDEVIKNQANLTFTKLLKEKLNRIGPDHKSNIISNNLPLKERLKVLTLSNSSNDMAARNLAITLSKVKLYHRRYKKNPQFSKFYDSPLTHLPKQTKAVFLQTNYRSGSTFLGQIFNQHPDVFYTFEPLYLFKDNSLDLLDYRMNVIKSILQCDFISTGDVYGNLTWVPTKSSTLVQCLLNDMCFRAKTKGLCEKEMCLSKDKRASCTACGPLNLNKLNNFCRSHKMSATKVIRLSNLSKMQSIAEDPEMDVKIIHLIRDPRGIASSRLRLKNNWNDTKFAPTCNRLLRNAKLATSPSAPKWLKKAYLQIRYEDLSLKPIEVAAKIYDFVGLEFVDEMRTWINLNTRADSSQRKTPYSTNRNSAATSEAWRTQLTLDQVKDVQKSCMSAMNYFGYIPVWNLKDLQNMNTSLVSHQ